MEKTLKKNSKKTISKQKTIINNKKPKSINKKKLPKMITKNVSEPWFSLIKLNLKTIEGRLNKGDFKDLRIDDIITWTNDDLGFHREFKTRVIGKTQYNTFEDYLLNEGLNHCLPGIEDIGDGLKVYFKYYTKEQEKEFGIVAIELKKINI